MAFCPEARRLFVEMTVEENLDMGSLRGDAKQMQRTDEEMVFGLFPRLKERRKQLAGTLSGGEQQMVAIGRGLMSLPKLLMFDEPSLGLAPILVREIFDVIRKIQKEGTTVLIGRAECEADARHCRPGPMCSRPARWSCREPARSS